MTDHDDSKYDYIYLSFLPKADIIHLLQNSSPTLLS